MHVGCPGIPTRLHGALQDLNFCEEWSKNRYRICSAVMLTKVSNRIGVEATTFKQLRPRQLRTSFREFYDSGSWSTIYVRRIVLWIVVVL